MITCVIQTRLDGATEMAELWRLGLAARMDARHFQFSNSANDSFKILINLDKSITASTQ